MTKRIDQLKALLKANPRDAFCLYGLAMEYAKLSRTADAIDSFNEAISLDPDFSYAYYHKAKAHERAGDLGAARNTLQLGLQQAQAVGDAQAVNEIAAYLDEFSE